MTMHEREGLIARIRQIRRTAAVPDQPDPSLADAKPEWLPALEARIAHLEGLVQGLQDSVHRESERHARLIAQLQADTHPSAMGAALAEDARNRGL
jgi:hypothetical protein